MLHFVKHPDGTNAGGMIIRHSVINFFQLMTVVIIVILSKYIKYGYKWYKRKLSKSTNP